MSKQSSTRKAITCTKEDIVQALDRCKSGASVDVGKFVRHVRPLVNSLKKMVSGGRAKDAVPLYQTLLSECRKRVGDCSDPDDVVSDIATTIIHDWIRARQRAAMQPMETVREILAWIEANPRGALRGFVGPIAEVLDTQEYRLFADHFREQFIRSLQILEPSHRLPGANPPEDVIFAQLAARAVYGAKGDLDAYALVCSAICLLSVDCLVLAEMAMDQKNCGLALKWVTRGLAIDDLSPIDDRCANSLNTLRSKLQAKQHLAAKSQ